MGFQVLHALLDESVTAVAGPKGKHNPERAACHLGDADRAESDLKALAALLEEDHPGAAASLQEGLAEILTVARLQLSPTLTRTLRSTNPIESVIGRGHDVARNVKLYRSGEMALRWTAAGTAEPQKSFRRVQGLPLPPATPSRP